MPELWAWMNGELVGRWHQGRTGYHRFSYEANWLASPKRRPLSLSLPIGPTRTVEGQGVAHYFDNLLPDSDAIRKRLAIRFRTGSTESFELLQAIGRDCVGAVQLLPPDELPVGFDRLAYRPLSEAEVEHHLLRVPSEPVFGAHEEGEDFRISLAGAQEKTALLRVGDQWCEPQGATPTTHILKLPLGLVGGRQLDLTHSIENEWLCGRILAELGISVAASEIAVFGHQKALVVERFDRRPMVNWIARLPQEDFCQVFGKAPTTKYEKDGGPGMADILKVLAHSETADADTRDFLKAQLAFWLLAATDGHAKNFSIFLLPGLAYRLTPLYDVLSAWPVIGHGANRLPLQKVGLAMALHAKNVHYRLNEMQPRHWRQLARQSGVEGAWVALWDMVEAADQAVDRVARQLPAGFPTHTAQTIFEGVRRQRGQFLQSVDE
jgi:serine/threonine-protein kinase HipA